MRLFYIAASVVAITTLLSCIPLEKMGGEGEPCSAGGACLEGFACVDGTCVKQGSVTADGGADGATSSDGGGTDAATPADGGGKDGGCTNECSNGTTACTATGQIKYCEMLSGCFVWGEPQNCDGTGNICDQSAGQCVPCGFAGNPCCADSQCTEGMCHPSNHTCVVGDCATSCTGCCSPAQECKGGGADNECGIGGAQCITCSGGKHCDPGSASCVAADTDGGTGDGGGCVPETDLQFCARSGVTCDSFMGVDNCGNNRNVPSCGNCISPLTCGGGGHPHICGGGTCDGTTCPNGCCDPSNNCYSGAQDGLCGKGGAKCESCLPGVCVAGVCQGATDGGTPDGGGGCGSGNCAGCCNDDQCLPGTTSYACGRNGTKCEDCSIYICGGGICSDAPCSSESENRECGNCGTQSRQCSSGAWGAWSACTGEGECPKGNTEQCDCGGGMTGTRTCGASCSWGACGNCQSGVEICNDGIDNNGKDGIDCQDPTCAGQRCATSHGWCQGGQCQVGCMIGGQFYSPGQKHTVCTTCDPTANDAAWTPLTDDPCDDGLYCTDGDKCNGSGICVGGSQRPCTTPPANSCSGGTLTTYGAGSCSEALDACEYGHSDTVCQYGCSGGACNPCTPNCGGKCTGADDGCGGTCASSTCSGCCDGTVCTPGGNVATCGGGGQPCVNCGAHASSCSGGVCVCQSGYCGSLCGTTMASEDGDGTCADGVDNDCNGKKDCAEAGCERMRCAAHNQFCSAQLCITACRIGGAIYIDGQTNADGCKKCSLADSDEAWTDKNNGDACPSDGNECTDDKCQAGVCGHQDKPQGAACTGGICHLGVCCTPSCAGKCMGADDDCGGMCPSTDCAGCCNGTSACLGGNAAANCGFGGEACKDCTLTSTNCVSGNCE